VGPGASRLAPGSLLAAGVSSLLHDNTVGKTPAPGPLLGVSIRHAAKRPRTRRGDEKLCVAAAATDLLLQRGSSPRLIMLLQPQAVMLVRWPRLRQS
jgi:hypothetical protein